MTTALPFCLYEEIDDSLRTLKSWHVNPTGNYTTDCAIGEAFALHLVEAFKSGEIRAASLTDAVMQMPREQDRTGVEIGFLEKLGHILGGAEG